MQQSIAALTAALAVVTGVRASQQAPAAPPVFRAGTTLVPVDVRVVDKHDQPVTDLRVDDFTILEDGAPQTIAHFSTESFADGAPATADPRTPVLDSDSATGRRRVFLVVLGSTDLQVPANGLDGVIQLFRTGMLPRDLAALIAFNRATDFTTDHVRLADIVERYKRDWRRIRWDIGRMFVGVAPEDRGWGLPPKAQAMVDAVFDPSGMGGVHTTVPDPAFTQAHATPTGQTGVTLNEMMGAYNQGFNEVANLYIGISYLARLEGEKHLLWVTQYGIQLPRVEDERDIARAAADGRIAIDIVHTGGVTDVSVAQTNYMLSGMTGGRYYANRLPRAIDDMRRIDELSRFEYLLGYYSTSAALDGKYRKIEVRVNRPGLKVISRQGYYAHAAPAPLDRQQLLTYSRLSAAAASAEDIPDIRLQIEARVAAGAPGRMTAHAHGSIDISALAMPERDGHRTGSIDIVMLALDSRHQAVAQSWKTIGLSLTSERYSYYLQNGVPYDLSAETTKTVKYIEVIAYEYASDRLGSRAIAVPKAAPPR